MKRKVSDNQELERLREKVKLLERIVELQDKLASVNPNPIYVPQPYPVYPWYPTTPVYPYQPIIYTTTTWQTTDVADSARISYESSFTN